MNNIEQNTHSELTRAIKSTISPFHLKRLYDEHTEIMNQLYQYKAKLRDLQRGSHLIKSQQANRKHTARYYSQQWKLSYDDTLRNEPINSIKAYHSPNHHSESRIGLSFYAGLVEFAGFATYFSYHNMPTKFTTLLTAGAVLTGGLLGKANYDTAKTVQKNKQRLKNTKSKLSTYQKTNLASKNNISPQK